MPAQAGIHSSWVSLFNSHVFCTFENSGLVKGLSRLQLRWMPACAGMTDTRLADMSPRLTPSDWSLTFTNHYLIILFSMKIGVIYTALSGILYGSIGYFGATLMGHGFSVSNLLVWRFFLSSALLLPVFLTWMHNPPQIDWKSWIRLFLFGAIFYAGGTAMYFEASKSIGTGLAMVIFFAYPIVVVALSSFLHKTSFTLTTLLSLILIVVGCTLIALGEKFSVDVYGIALAAGSGVGYGLYVFFSKEASKNVPPALATFIVCLGGTVAFIPCALLFDGDIQVPADSYLWMMAILFALVGTVLPVMFMLVGLKTISANKASIISVLEPVTTLAVGAFILAEEVFVLQFVGAIIILSSAVLVQLEKEV